MSYQEYSGRRPDRLQAHQDSKGSIDIFRRREDGSSREKWSVYDSPLGGGFIRLLDYNSFHRSFERVIPPGIKLKAYIEDALADQRDRAVGIEFGGPGSTLFSGFSDGFFARSLGVTLTDQRSSVKINRDNERNHQVIAADLRTEEAKGKVVGWLNGEPADLIIERMVGGLALVPKDPYLMAFYLSQWYRMMSERGIMLVQAPDFTRKLTTPWMEHMKADSGGTIDVSYDGRDDELYNTLRIQKMPGAPAEIPLLSPRKVRKAYRKTA